MEFASQVHVSQRPHFRGKSRNGAAHLLHPGVDIRLDMDIRKGDGPSLQVDLADTDGCRLFALAGGRWTLPLPARSCRFLRRR